jgi:membrane peptidoglycan carboxypeptidase
LNLNEGSKLELGSTAKLRTLTTYLEIITDLHSQLVEGKNRGKLPVDDPDHLTKWAAEYLLQHEDHSLKAMLEAAMNRVYSASPGEAFFTGGGLHTFANFDNRDDGRRMTVREAIQRSVNLVFIRLMRDVVDYYLRRIPSYSREVFENEASPVRARLLARFADREGSIFLRSYYDRYAGLNAAEQLETLFEQRELTPTRFAVMHRSVRPTATLAEFQLAMQAFIPKDVPESRVLELYDRYGPGKFNWQDRGYVAGMHPLELWLVSYLGTNPDAGWEQVKEASAAARQEVYRWLLKSRHKHAQDTRIRTVLETDAFQLIFQSWKKQGFPFRSMVPSLASAIGSSGDTPAALAELAGIILNGGVRLPTMRVERFRFAEGTPFETRIVRKSQDPVQVMTPEVAAQLHKEMLGVVEFGTARRAFRSVTGVHKEILDVAGKTGTGDNRIKTLHEVGKARNRTAAFVFTVGDRYFGSIVAYVPGEQASAYRFSSAVPVQVFKLIVPQIVKELEGERANQRARR